MCQSPLGAAFDLVRGFDLLLTELSPTGLTHDFSDFACRAERARPRGSSLPTSKVDVGLPHVSHGKITPLCFP
jgi:hypothetical protein